MLYLHVNINDVVNIADIINVYDCPYNSISARLRHQRPKLAVILRSNCGHAVRCGQLPYDRMRCGAVAVTFLGLRCGAVTVTF